MANKHKKEQFNLYTFMHRKKKTVVLGICLMLVFTLVAGLFAQFAFM